MSSSLIS